MPKKERDNNMYARQNGLMMYAVEAEFSDSGYRLSWNNRVIMHVTERQLFTEYLRSRDVALLRICASNAVFRNVSPSVRALRELASNMLRAVSVFENIDELEKEICAFPEKFTAHAEEMGITRECAGSILNNILCGLRVLCADDNTQSPNAAIDTLFSETSLSGALSFVLEENTGSMTLSVRCGQKTRDLALSDAMYELAGHSAAIERIIAPIKHLAEQSDIVKRFLGENDKIIDSIQLSAADVYAFLTEIDLYERNGISCKMPQRWRKRKGKISLGVALGNREAVLGSNALISFDINLCIDGKPLTPEELAKISESDGELFLLRGQWVELTRGEVKKALSAFEHMQSEYNDEIVMADAIRAFLAPEKAFEDYDIDVDVSDGEWLRKLGETLINPHVLGDIDLGQEFRAQLRPYQRDGVKWLLFMYRIGLGACLCDDMGLGKTVQAIALLEYLRINNRTPSLIIIPASLLQNWQQELMRFAPGIRFKVLHNSVSDLCLDPTGNTDVYITTYSMAARVHDITTVSWNCIVIDEAQAIKNPQTMQSRAIKRLNAKFKLAMTGTPVENSAMDLWSIFDFLNPGLLGSARQFQLMVNNSAFDHSRLRTIVKPFLLRRVKTDKAIISELPDKIEMKCYCSLTKNQAVMYKRVTDMLEGNISGAEGIERRGMVLSCILRLKQICNHPDQFEGRSAYSAKESGKFMRVAELCENIRDAGEKVLVFTQFKEMCEPLSDLLAEVFNRRGFVLHGSTSVAERGSIVDDFNNATSNVPYMVLSLRAGGIGLNLTAANHVIHFDRWWNPAVENQATDRAFRIGQTKNVIVHKLICSGTLEEKIDAMIESKRSLADDIVGFDAKLTEMSDSEIISLLKMD